MLLIAHLADGLLQTVQRVDKNCDPIDVLLIKWFFFNWLVGTRV